MSRRRPAEVLRLDPVPDDQLQAWIAFVQPFGVDPTRARPQLVITQDDDGYHLHLSIKTQHPSGRGDWLDLATNQVVSTPLIIDLGHERNWPHA